MASPIFELFATLSLNANEFDEELEKKKGDASKFASSFGNAFKSMAKVGATAFAVASGAIAKFGTDAVKSYAEYEQLVGGVQKLYGNAGQSLEEYAQKTGRSVDKAKSEWQKLENAQNTVIKNAQNAFLTSGMSMNEYMQTATGLSGSLIKSLNGDTQKAAKITDVAMRAMSDNVNTFGTDAGMVQSAFMGLSRQNYMMIDNLKLGYAGTAQGMLELINDSGVLGKQLKKTSELADVGFDQMILAIDAIQKKQGIWGTTQREALKTLEGSATATKKAWENVITSIGKGEGLSDALSGLSTALFGTGGEGEGFLNNIIPRIQTVMEGIGEFVAQAGPIISERLPELFDAIFPPLFETATTLIANLATALPELFTMLFPSLMESASTLVSTLFTYIVENAPKLLEAGVQMLENLAQGVRNNLPTLIATGLDMMTQFLGEIISSIPDILKAGVDLILALIDGIGQSAPDVIEAISQIVSDAWDAFTSVDWLSVGKSIIDGIVSGISKFGSAIGSKLKEMASNAFNGVKKFFGINSPSRLMRDNIGKFIPLGLAEGINDEADSVYDAMEELASGTEGAYDPLFDDVFNQSMVTKSNDADNPILNGLKELKEAILGMNVVLDSGATVGALAPAMDSTLGSFSVYKGRGN